jgi:hypothetical protein
MIAFEKYEQTATPPMHLRQVQAPNHVSQEKQSLTRNCKTNVGRSERMVRESTSTSASAIQLRRWPFANRNHVLPSRVVRSLSERNGVLCKVVEGVRGAEERIAQTAICRVIGRA